MRGAGGREGGGGAIASGRWKVSRNVEEEAGDGLGWGGRERWGVAAGHIEHGAASEASTQTRALPPGPPLK